ncbi:MAG: hypothetical protein ACJ735_02585 [Actinomycetes bacterium]
MNDDNGVAKDERDDLKLDATIVHPNPYETFVVRRGGRHDGGIARRHHVQRMRPADAMAASRLEPSQRLVEPIM